MRCLLLLLALGLLPGCPEGDAPADPVTPPATENHDGKKPDAEAEWKKLLAEAEKRLHDGQPAAAYGILEQASLKYGERPTYLGLIGRTSWALGHYGEARKHWEAALKASPNQLDANLGMLWADLGQRELKKAEDRLRVSEEKLPKEAQPHLAAFRCHLEVSRMDPLAAKEASQKAIEADPKNAEAHRCAALVDMKAQPGKAAEHLVSAGTAEPGHPRNEALLGLLSNTVGDPEKAQGHFEKSIKSGEKDPWVWMWGIRSAMNQGDLEKSEARLKAAKKALPISFPDLVRLEAELSLTTDSRKAQHLMRNLEEEHPGDPAIMILLARSHQARGDIGRARDAYAEAIKLAPNHLDGYFLAGEGMFRLGKVNESQNYFDELLKRDPNRIDALIQLAELHGLRKDPKAMLDAFDRAGKLLKDPTTLDCQKGSLLSLYFPNKKKQHKAMVAALASCIKKNPSHATAYKSLAVHYDNSKVRNKAIPHYISHMKKVESDPANHFIRDRLLALKVSKSKIPEVKAALPDIEDVETKRRWRRRVGSRSWKKTVSTYRSRSSYGASAKSEAYASSAMSSCNQRYLSCVKSCSYYSKSNTAAGYRLYQSCRNRCGSNQSMCYRRIR
jgi:tetratricopeptide (TPR) repeat protein